MQNIELEFEAKCNSIWWCKVNQKYWVRIDSLIQDGVCTCMWGTMRISNPDRKPCKHIKAVLKEVEKEENL